MNDAAAPLLPDLKAQVDYYRARGEEVRKRAASITSAAARSKFLQFADTYDRLALARRWQASRTGGLRMTSSFRSAAPTRPPMPRLILKSWAMSRMDKGKSRTSRERYNRINQV